MKLTRRTPTLLGTALLLAPLAAAQVPGSELWSAQGADSYYDEYGKSLANVGDLDGDGIADFAVGAPQEDSTPNDGQTAEGAVHVLSGADGSEILTFQGNTPGGYFGNDVAGLGDLDGDGVGEILVGASFENAAYVFSGADGSLLRSHAQMFTAGFGKSVASAGDVDADGIADYVIGAGDITVGQTYAGAYVYSGQSGALLFNVSNPPYPNGLGADVAGIGDVTGDGFGDLVVCGQYEVLLVSGQTGSILDTFDTCTTQCSATARCTAIGDVDGDGRPEFAIGRPSDQQVASAAGRVTLYTYLPGSGVSALWSHYGSLDYEQLGHQIAAAGDVNADGVPDVIASAPFSQGAVYVYSGDTGAVLLTLEGETSSGFGYAVCGAGDLTGDGYADFLASSRKTGPSPFTLRAFSGGPDAFVPYGASNPNSTGSAAEISVSGSTSIATNDLVLSVGPVPNTPGLFFFGPAQTALPFGDGVLLVGGGLKRLLPVIASANTLTAAIDNTLPGVSNLLTPDSLWNFQAWFRDPAAGGAGFNTSNAVQIHFLP